MSKPEMSREQIAYALRDLLQRSGQRRLELMSRDGVRCGGYCVDASGEHWFAHDYLDQP